VGRNPGRQHAPQQQIVGGLLVAEVLQGLQRMGVAQERKEGQAVARRPPFVVVEKAAAREPPGVERDGQKKQSGDRRDRAAPRPPEIVRSPIINVGPTGSNLNDRDKERETMSSGLQSEDLKVGSGAEAKAGHTVAVHYTGWLTNGTKFDSSLDRGQPFSFELGAGRVIKGWDEGVAGMKVGGQRKLTISPELGYGARGAGAVIPPGATLVFEVELLSLR
jgi:FKBP-type peptidyl-prolyl cis-trans isomerase FkpA